MLKILSFSTAIAVFSAAAVLGAAGSETVNFAGTYKCEGDMKKCDIAGDTYTVTQNGNTLDVKNDKGAIGQGKVTSDITISMGPPWNSFGVVQQNKTIQWSNGTDWKKQ